MTPKGDINRGKGGNMRRYVGLILSIILIITSSGCFWVHDRRGYDDRDHRGHDRDGHGDHRGYDDHR